MEISIKSTVQKHGVRRSMNSTSSEQKPFARSRARCYETLRSIEGLEFLDQHSKYGLLRNNLVSCKSVVN
jgi:hypothetical protein